MAFNYSPKTVTDGLVLYLDAANIRSYVSGSTRWNDISRGGNNGTLTNGPTFNSGNGGSIVFDGVDDYVDTSYVLPTGFNYSMACWAKSSTSGINNRPVGNADNNVGLTGADIIWGFPTSTTLYIVRRAGSNDGTRDMTYSVPNLLTVAHHIFVTYDSAIGSKLYVDGVQVTQNTNLGFTSTLPFRVGRDGNGTTAFNGTVYNVQIYDRALSSQEVLQNYNALKGRFGL